MRGDTFGYLQRSFLGCVSDVDQKEARAVGVKAVQFAARSGRDGSVAIRRRKGNRYAAEFKFVALAAVAGRTRVMPAAFIARSGTDVTKAFDDYLRPLVGAKMPPTYRLSAPKVRKILNRT